MFKKIYQPIVILVILLASFTYTGTALAWSGCGSTYTVQWGDTLSRIATNCGTTVAALQLGNPGLGTWIYAGQVLILPGASWDNGNGYSTYVVAHGDTLRLIAARYGTTVDTLARLNSLLNYNLIYAGQWLTVPNGSYVPPPPPPSGATTYVIRTGDTLRKLASYWGVTVNDILAVNPQITNPSLIYVGQVINVPGSSGTPSTPIYYTIQRGDTLRNIATRYGTTVYSLQLLNPQIWNPNWIYVGMVIRVQ
jgi:LysM repeat protein